MRKTIEALKTRHCIESWTPGIPALIRLTAFLLLLAPAAHAQSLAGEALTKARAGRHEEALQLYRQALAEEPNDLAVMRDYAVVLGWAGKYAEAIPLIKKVRAIENRQPEWALREFAAIYLFGDALADALRTLDELVERGETSEQTLNRRALALRWLKEYGEAESAYRTLLDYHPDSKEGMVGLAYTLSDRGKLTKALKLLDSPAPELMKARIRILNWSGAHYQAQRLLDELPPGLENDREVLEDRIAASRWGGDPASAVHGLQRLASLYPGAETARLSRDLRSEYGHRVRPVFRFSRDSFGLTEGAVAHAFVIHLSPAHALQIGHEYRWFEQEMEDSRALVRYDMGWSGNIGRRLVVNVTAATVDYRRPGLQNKIIGDASVAFNLNDRLRLGGGGGTIVMDAYPALRSQVTAAFEFGEVALRLDSKMQVEARVSHYSFSDNISRKRAGFRFTRAVFANSALKARLGWRAGSMWHDRQTADFWSPQRFHSHLATAQVEGRAASWLAYSGEIAGGFQAEAGSGQQHPLEISGKLVVEPDPRWRSLIEIGKSTSSVDRVGPGQRTYSRWVFSAGMELRFP